MARSKKNRPPRAPQTDPNKSKCQYERANSRILAHTTSAQGIQDAIDYQWKMVSIKDKKFILDRTCARDLTLRKLVNFWLCPERNIGRSIAGTNGKFALDRLCCTFWHLAYLYIFQGEIDLAKTLLINGAFLLECSAQDTVIINLHQNIDKLSCEYVKENTPLYQEGVLAAANKESMMKYIDHYLPPSSRRMMEKGSSSSYVDSISSEWNITSSSSQQMNKSTITTRDANDASIAVIFRFSDINEQVQMTIGLSTPLKTAFNKYSEDCKTSLRSLRFSYKGKTLILSSVGKKTPEQLGMSNLDSIDVSMIVKASPLQKEVTLKEVSSRDSPVRENKMMPNMKGRSKKSRSCQLPVDQYAEFKIRHSEALTKLFNEAGTKFKEIRQELDSLNIERTKPKVRIRHKKPVITANQSINNPLMDGIGGKAGKTSFVVQVGEVNNLYKSSKLLIRRGNALKELSPIVVDLHGLTRDQALSKLDECLPEWTDVAMRGLYPFVQPVVIVCGGGNQILSESIEHWIRQNDKVSKAPKNLLPRKHFAYNNTHPA